MIVFVQVFSLERYLNYRYHNLAMDILDQVHFVTSFLCHRGNMIATVGIMIATVENRIATMEIGLPPWK